MKKRLGVLTFHSALNYGAVLQGFAMKKVFEEYGFEVYFIRYSGFDITEIPNPFSLLKHINKIELKSLIRSILGYPWDKRRFSEFTQFRNKNFSETKLCTCISDIVNLGYDAYVAGSDQIWNYHITGGRFDDVFFLRFNTHAKQIIYAASSHNTPFEQDKEKDFCKLLMSTNARIGIRESSLAQYACELTGVDYPVVLDPTLLVDKSVFNSIEVSCLENQKYILLYQIDNNPDSDVSVEALKSFFNCRVYSLSIPRIDSFRYRLGHKGPGEFLSIIKNALFIVTNSFHGVALSIVYEKQFFVYDNGGVTSRVDDLLELLEIKNRKILNVADIIPDNRIDYSMVNKRLEKEKMYSIGFIEQALKGNSDE